MKRNYSGGRRRSVCISVPAECGVRYDADLKTITGILRKIQILKQYEKKKKKHMQAVTLKYLWLKAYYQRWGGTRHRWQTSAQSGSRGEKQRQNLNHTKTRANTELTLDPDHIFVKISTYQLLLTSELLLLILSTLWVCCSSAHPT